MPPVQESRLSSPLISRLIAQRVTDIDIQPKSPAHRVSMIRRAAIALLRRAAASSA